MHTTRCGRFVRTHYITQCVHLLGRVHTCWLCVLQIRHVFYYKILLRCPYTCSSCQPNAHLANTYFPPPYICTLGLAEHACVFKGESRDRRRQTPLAAAYLYRKQKDQTLKFNFIISPNIICGEEPGGPHIH